MTKRQKKIFESFLTKKQRLLYRRHGHPGEFAKGVYACVPYDISVDEAREAVEKYQKEWDESAKV